RQERCRSITYSRFPVACPLSDAMLIFIAALPPIVALLCLALSDRVPARQLGIAAAAALLACGVALLTARLTGQLPLTLVDRAWLALDDRTFTFTLVCDAANWGF